MSQADRPGDKIDTEALRQAVREECLAAYFGGGIGGALTGSFDADRASPEELIRMARNWGIDPNRYHN